MATPSSLKHRYFFALLPDAVTACRIHAFAGRQFGERGLVRADRLHVTLALTGDLNGSDDVLAQALIRAGATVAAPPFDLPLDQMGGGQRTVALRPAHAIAPLRALQASISRAMIREGVAMRPEWRFSPHLTLIYCDGDNHPVRPVEGFGWAVREFVLIESFVGISHYDVLGRWALRDTQGDLFP